MNCQTNEFSFSLRSRVDVLECAVAALLSIHKPKSKTLLESLGGPAGIQAIKKSTTLVDAINAVKSIKAGH